MKSKPFQSMMLLTLTEESFAGMRTKFILLIPMLIFSMVGCDNFTRESHQIEKPKYVLEEFNRAVELDQTDANAYYTRGFVRSKLEDYQGAISDFNRAIKLNPKHATAYVNRGFVKGKLGDYRGAISDYDKTIKLDASNSKAYHNRGLARCSFGDIEGGCLDLSKAGELGAQGAYEAIKDLCN